NVGSRVRFGGCLRPEDRFCVPRGAFGRSSTGRMRKNFSALGALLAWIVLGLARVVSAQGGAYGLACYAQSFFQPPLGTPIEDLSHAYAPQVADPLSPGAVRMQLRPRAARGAGPPRRRDRCPPARHQLASG